MKFHPESGSQIVSKLVVEILTKTAISKQIVFYNNFKEVSSQRKPIKECTRHPNVSVTEHELLKMGFAALSLISATSAILKLKRVNIVYLL